MKRLLSFIILICIIAAALPMTVSAEENYVNLDDAITELRAGMVNRETEIAIKFKSPEFLTQETLAAIFNSAVEDTGDPLEGDYLHWHVENFGISGSYYVFWDYFYYDIIFRVSYYTTAEQESELDEAINDVIDGFGFNLFTSDYVKIQTVYDYICQNVAYDYDNLGNSSYTLKYSAYAALIDKKAVCQGYANLFYRFMRELEIDCRTVTGKSKSQSHAWNIVKLDGAYYNVDTTWDAGAKKYNYFLKCTKHFTDHERNDEYLTDDFEYAYPIAKACYAPTPTISECERSGHDMGEWYTTREATCTLNGEERRSCKRCEYYEIHVLSAIPHTEGDWTVVKQAEVGVVGLEELRCSVCNTLLDQRDIDALEPEPKPMLGDINGNGKIEKYDYILVKRLVMSTIDLSGETLNFADINKNGRVEKYDYILVKRHVMGTYVIEDPYST